MAETLGMLCDKLTIVKLKEYHTDDENRLASLAQQSDRLRREIDEYIYRAVKGEIPADDLVFESNKVFKKDAVKIPETFGKIGSLFYQLADVNCRLWHEQEKVYEFERVPVDQKDVVVKKLAELNLERNNCIDAIDRQFAGLLEIGQ